MDTETKLLDAFVNSKRTGPDDPRYSREFAGVCKHPLYHLRKLEGIGAIEHGKPARKPFYIDGASAAQTKFITSASAQQQVRELRTAAVIKYLGENSGARQVALDFFKVTTLASVEERIRYSKSRRFESKQLKRYNALVLELTKNRFTDVSFGELGWRQSPIPWWLKPGFLEQLSA